MGCQWREYIKHWCFNLENPLLLCKGSSNWDGLMKDWTTDWMITILHGIFDSIWKWSHHSDFSSTNCVAPVCLVQSPHGVITDFRSSTNCVASSKPTWSHHSDFRSSTNCVASVCLVQSPHDATINFIINTWKMILDRIWKYTH